MSQPLGAWNVGQTCKFRPKSHKGKGLACPKNCPKRFPVGQALGHVEGHYDRR